MFDIVCKIESMYFANIYRVLAFTVGIVALSGLASANTDDDFFYQKVAKYVDLHFKAPVALESDKFVCEQYLAPSKWLDGGIGVFAGRKYQANEKMQPGVSLVFPLAKLPNTQLKTYVYGGLPITDDMFVDFGPSMLYNHHDKNNLRHKFADDWTGDVEYVNRVVRPQLSTLQQWFAHSIFPQCIYLLLEDVQPGDELFSEYGGEKWFNDFGIQMKTPERSHSRYESLEELESVGHCLTNVHVARSTIPGAGKGVFASRAFKKGEVIEVSPVLAVGANDAAELSGESSVFLNYCFAHPKLSIALMPIGTVGALNHGGASANVAYDLHFWGGWHTAEKILSKTPESILESKFADIFFQYTAARDIAKGQELTIDYGSAWESAWLAHQEKLAEFSIFEAPLPLFRHHIELRADLLPSHWFVDPAEHTEAAEVVQEEPDL